MNKKIVVIECSNDIWINIIKKLMEEENWRPVYWTVGSRYLSIDIIKTSFSEIIVHENYDAVRGIPAKEFSTVTLPPVDAEILQSFSYHESVVVKMMDRMDPQGIFVYSDRLRLYHYYLKYWLYVLDVLKPDIFMATSTAHLCYDYVLYQLCRFKGIKCIIFVETTIPYLLYINEYLEGIPSLLQKNYNRLLDKNGDAKISVSTEEYLDKISNTYKEALPSYMIEQFETDMSVSRRKSLVQKILDKFKRKGRHIKNTYFTKWNLQPVPIYYKVFGANIEDRTLIRNEFNIYRNQMIKKTDALKLKYLSLIVPVDFTKPYVLVALMYQPERSSSPDGGLFVHQYLMIEWLSYSVPDGWMIYVKEHPTQFIEKVDNTRNDWMYDDIVKLTNVKLISTNIDTFELIDNSKAVATLTGTIGFETVIRGKPVLCFGYAWYRGCEGVLEIQSLEQLKIGIEKIKNGYKPVFENVRKYIQALEEIGVKGYVNAYYAKGFEYEENVNNLKEAIVRFEVNESINS